MNIHVIIIDKVVYLFVFSNKIGKAKAPNTPITSELTDDVLFLLFCLINSIFYLCKRIDSFVVNFCQFRLSFNTESA